MKCFATSVKTPGANPDLRRDHGSLEDVIRRSKTIEDFIRLFETFTITTETQRLEVLGRLAFPVSNSTLFNITQNGTSATVARGIVLATKWPASLAGATMPDPDKKCARISIAAKTVTIAPGQFIYLKLTYSLKTATPIGLLPDDDKVHFDGGTITGGMGGAGGNGGSGGGGGGGAGGGGGGGGGGATPGAGGGAGSAGGFGTAGGAPGAVAQDGVAGTDGTVGFIGSSGGSGTGGDGGGGGGGGTGGNGGTGQTGEAAPTLEEDGGPSSVDIPEFDAYRKAKLEVKVYEITGEIVCEASTDADGYIPLAEISGTAENPVVDVWHKGGYITAPQPTVINVTP